MKEWRYFQFIFGNHYLMLIVAVLMFFTVQCNSQNARDSLVQQRLLAERSIVLLQNKNNTIPVQNLEKCRIATIFFGDNNSGAVFRHFTGVYTAIAAYHMQADSLLYPAYPLSSYKNDYNLLVIAIQSEKLRDQAIKNMVNNYMKARNVILCVFGDVEKIVQIQDFKSAKAIITAPDSGIFYEMVPQLIFGGIGAKGKLSESIGTIFPSDAGLKTPENIRFKYTIPEEAGLDNKLLQKKIDSIVTRAIRSKAFPGCRILIARKRKVVWDKCYGYHTYDSTRAVSYHDIYDLASITKITGPLPALMKLYEQHKIDLDTSFSTYWKEFKNTDKDTISLREILAHQAGLQPWIPYWRSMVRKNGAFKWRTVKNRCTLRFPIRISDSLYLHRSFKKRIYKAIQTSPIQEKKYKYSGLAFYLFPEIIENLTKQKYENYLKQKFYEPLGAYSLVFNAYTKYPKSRIVPTEKDTFFRHELLHGFVHDEGAALMGGVSGNAGLFATAYDLAKIMQMYLQKGEYAMHRYIADSVVTEFTRCQFAKQNNRRGLGFDKPYLENNKKELKDAYPAPSTSMKSFGHGGYTGTFAWADPENELLFIFLSNRVYPRRENIKLYSLNVRPSLHQAIYDAIKH